MERIIYLFWVGLSGAGIEHERQRLENSLYQRRAARALRERCYAQHSGAPLRSRYGLAQPRQFHRDVNLGADPGADVQVTVETLDGGNFHPEHDHGDGSGDITADVGTLALTNAAIIRTRSLIRLGQGGNVTVQGLQGPGSAATNLSLNNSTMSTQISGGTATSTPATFRSPHTHWPSTIKR